MSKKLFAFLLSELKTVRIICKHDNCGVVVEVPVDKLNDKFGGSGAVKCIHCGRLLTEFSIAAVNPFSMVHHAIIESQRKDAKFDIEFVLPDNAK